MSFDRLLENGSEVLIFSKAYDGKVEYCEHIIKGIIKRQKYPVDYFIHSSSCNHISYEVLGEDGRMYYGTYGRPYINDNFFLIKHDYVECLYNKMVYNNAKINEIERENTKINNLIEAIQDDKNNSKKR